MNEDGIVDGRKQCEGPCGSINDEKTDDWDLFCDDKELCKQYGISDGGCVDVS